MWSVGCCAASPYVAALSDNPVYCNDFNPQPSTLCMMPNQAYMIHLLYWARLNKAERRQVNDIELVDCAY